MPTDGFYTKLLNVAQMREEVLRELRTSPQMSFIGSELGEILIGEGEYELGLAAVRGARIRVVVDASRPGGSPEFVRLLREWHACASQVEIYFTAEAPAMEALALFIFKTPDGCKVFRSGGYQGEGMPSMLTGGASMGYLDPSGRLADHIATECDALARDGKLLTATQARIDAYERASRMWATLQDAMHSPVAGKVSLKEVFAKRLSVLKNDSSASGFSQQELSRRKRLRLVRSRLEELHGSNAPRSAFLTKHRELLAKNLLLLLGEVAGVPDPSGGVTYTALICALDELAGFKHLPASDLFLLAFKHFPANEHVSVAIASAIAHVVEPRKCCIFSPELVVLLAIAFPDDKWRNIFSLSGDIAYARLCQRAIELMHMLGVGTLARGEILMNSLSGRGADLGAPAGHVEQGRC